MHITVDKKSHYAANPDLGKHLTEKVTLWAASVPAGTFATLAEVMNYGGYPNGMPVETWTDPFENGSVPQVELLTQYGPTCAMSFGMPKMVHKIV